MSPFPPYNYVDHVQQRIRMEERARRQRRAHVKDRIEFCACLVGIAFFCAMFWLGLAWTFGVLAVVAG